MNVYDYAEKILLNGDLESKLLPCDCIDWEYKKDRDALRALTPARNEKIKISPDQVKFPGKGALKNKQERGKALHFFANHELLAIEMMAQALLLFPEWSTTQKKLVVKTLSEEQKHFNLYHKRMKEFGVEFGDFPLNSFFWSFMEKIETSDQFFSVISLTFEQANLDFASYYMEVFKDLGDLETHDILKEVYEDEIRHVARGRTELLKKISDPDELWEYYCHSLPHVLTPSRAKGMVFDHGAREKAGLDKVYIESLKNYQNSFSITNRKQWKN